jgi:pyruvate dehydrogenase E1 component alpha subunit
MISLSPNLPPDKQREMLRQMLTIRRFEERASADYLAGKIYGVVHCYIGEEAVAVGVCTALERSDRIISTHRGHGHCIAKGADLNRMMAELYGRQTGYCKGKGGSMHIADPDTGNLGANAIVCGSAGIATGAALSAKRLKTGQVAVCFFGDGAMGQGLLYEVMNMAALWKLPVIYVCENNLYNEYTHNSETLAGDILTRAAGFGVPGESVDGQDVRKVFATMKNIVERVRQGAGPAFLVCNTYRFHGHHVGDVNREYYRSKQEEQMWKTERDPIKVLGDWLTGEHHADRARMEQVHVEVKSEVDKAVAWALAAPYPNVDKVDQDVYA